MALYFPVPYPHHAFHRTELVPSSARSVSSAASPLPQQLVPLLQDPLDKLKEIIAKILPDNKKRTALEEAEWEDEGGEGALERELLMQCEYFAQHLLCVIQLLT